MARYRVEFLPRVLRALEKIPKTASGRILRDALALGDNPHPHGFVKLSGEDDTYRIVVGTYRVLYQIIGGELLVLVVKIGHRREVYRGL